MIFVKLYSVILSCFCVLLSTVFTTFPSNQAVSKEICAPQKSITDTYKKDSLRTAHTADSLLKVMNYKCTKLAEQQDTIKKQQAELLTIAKLH